MSQDDYWVC